MQFSTVMDLANNKLEVHGIETHKFLVHFAFFTSASVIRTCLDVATVVTTLNCIFTNFSVDIHSQARLGCQDVFHILFTWQVLELSPIE
jgi:hypothetical protein